MSFQQSFTYFVFQSYSHFFLPGMSEKQLVTLVDGAYHQENRNDIEVLFVNPLSLSPRFLHICNKSLSNWIAKVYAIVKKLQNHGRNVLITKVLHGIELSMCLESCKTCAYSPNEWGYWIACCCKIWPNKVLGENSWNFKGQESKEWMGSNPFSYCLYAYVGEDLNVKITVVCELKSTKPCLWYEMRSLWQDKFYL